MLHTISFPGTFTPYQRCPGIRRHLVSTKHRISASLPDKDGVKLEYTPWLIVGLGNPGNKYHGTRHNVGPLAAYYQVPLRHILLIYDEMSLPNGVLRLQPRGGHGHHNGLKSVMDHLDGSRSFPRLSIGIGNPPGTMDMKAFLLQKFSSEERNQIDAAIEQGVGAVRTLVLKGFNDNINRFNLGQKYKYHKVGMDMKV